MSWDELVGLGFAAVYATAGSGWLLLHATFNQALIALVIIMFVKSHFKQTER